MLKYSKCPKYFLPNLSAQAQMFGIFYKKKASLGVRSPWGPARGKLQLAARASLFVNLVNILNFLLQSWPALPKANNRKGCWHKSNRGPLLVHLLIEEKCHTLQPGIGRQRIQRVTAPEAPARHRHRAYHLGPNNHSGNWLLTLTTNMQYDW